MRIIRAGEHVTVPWKNGGGTATAIAGEPEGTGFEGFDWRLSGACVAREGPFSIFPGADRIMLILSAGRLVLHGAGPSAVVLTADSAPFRFPGDVLVTAEVPDGPIHNLNLMFDRRLEAAARRVEVAGERMIEPKAEGRTLVYCEAGAIEAGTERLAKDDTLIALAPVRIAGQGRAIVMDIWPRRA